MNRMVLLDANLLIGALDSEAGNSQHAQAQKRMKELLLDPEVKLAITPLIRYEVLRGAKNVSLADLDAGLNGFQEFEIKGSHARRAAEIFKAASSQGVELNKRRFDVFHCVCAELNGLVLESQDGDIPKIQQLMQAGKSNAQA